MNKIILGHQGPNWIYIPAGTEKFVNRWGNFARNYFSAESQETSEIPMPHFSIRKSKFKKYLIIAIWSQMRMKHGNMRLTEFVWRVKKVVNFYQNRVICKI